MRDLRVRAGRHSGGMEIHDRGIDRMKSFGLILLAFPVYLLVHGKLINYVALA